MKNKTLLLLILPFLMSAQFSPGIKGGMLISNLKLNDGISKGKGNASFYAGLFVSYKTKYLIPELDITYNNGGCTADVNLPIYMNGNIQNRSFSANYNYKTLDYTLSTRIIAAEVLDLRLGMYYADLIAAKQEISNYHISNYQNTNFNTDLTKSWNKSDYGVVLGFNLNFSKKVYIEVTYLLGLADVQNITKLDPIYNRRFRFGFGYRIFK